MPPRFAYWTILVGGLPTAFRAADREEIEPTFRRLRQKHPDAEMRWFARGKLWASPAEATAALRQRSADADRQSRDRSWRPGGTHRDPRQPYKDAKKRENQTRRERRFEFKQGSRPREERPKWAPSRPEPRAQSPKPAWKPKPWRRPEPGARSPESRDQRPPQKGTGPQAPGSRPLGDPRQKAKGEGQKEDRPRWEKPGPKWSKPPRRDWRPETGDRRLPKSGDQRPPQKDTGPQAPGSRPREERPKWKGPRPQATGSRPHQEQPKWKRPDGAEKPESEKPWKPQSRPGAWSPKPGANKSRPPRKGPRGPR